MKKAILLFVLAGPIWFTGCVSIPPLVQVEHKDAPPAQVSQDIVRRLDAIDQRLQRVEEKLDKK
jgi:hypothetical protein